MMLEIQPLNDLAALGYVLLFLHLALYVVYVFWHILDQDMAEAAKIRVQNIYENTLPYTIVLGLGYIFAALAISYAYLNTPL